MKDFFIHCTTMLALTMLGCNSEDLAARHDSSDQNPSVNEMREFCWREFARGFWQYEFVVLGNDVYFMVRGDHDFSEEEYRKARIYKAALTAQRKAVASRVLASMEENSAAEVLPDSSNPTLCFADNGRFQVMERRAEHKELARALAEGDDWQEMDVESLLSVCQGKASRFVEVVTWFASGRGGIHHGEPNPALDPVKVLGIEKYASNLKAGLSGLGPGFVGSGTPREARLNLQTD